MNPVLKSLADNQSLFEATKTYLEEKFEASFNTRDFPPDTSNEVLARYLHAKSLGLKLVEEAFKDIAQLKTPPPTPDRINLAR